ncbi:MAG: tRNA (guanine(46)-N(7))-methyltransferase TrmB [Pseudomonadota bacterium]
MADKPTHRSGAPWRNMYGRTKGNKLRASQQEWLAEDLADLSVGAVGWDINPERQQIEIKKLFGDRPLWLEVGFGGGEHLVHQAEGNPNVGFIGCEPYINGVAMLLGKIRKLNQDNIRIHPGDVRDLFDVLPEASVERTFLLYPDPWPKKKHHRRRFVTADYLEPLARVMKPGAILRVATDIPDYVRQALEVVPKHEFTWRCKGAQDWREPWGDWISTRYEQKALREGRVPHYLTFERI